MQKAIKEIKLRRKDESSTKKVPVESVSTRNSVNPYKKTSGSIPVSIVPKTIYLQAGDLLRPKSKCKMEPNRVDPRAPASQSHTRYFAVGLRKASVNNSRKESTADQQERKNSRDLIVTHNRSNSSLQRQQE